MDVAALLVGCFGRCPGSLPCVAYLIPQLLGFGVSNQYYYVSVDLGDEVINYCFLLSPLSPEQRAKWELEEERC